MKRSRSSHATPTTPQLFSSGETLQRPEATEGPSLEQRYRRFYSALAALREQFHRIGRFDDANAKLDELCKLLVLRTLDLRFPQSGNSRLDGQALRARAEREFGDPGKLAAALHSVYSELSLNHPREFGAFGANPKLNLPLDDDAFAAAVIPLLEALPSDQDHAGHEWSFDAVNEAFGHFIQDSFRNRKEDAQYMTPPEVVTGLVEIALVDMMRDPSLARQREWLVGDPTCGVGSFLAAFYRRSLGHSLQGAPLARRTRLFGQDKVERMARLATVNLKVFADAEAEIRVANSIVPADAMDDVAGKFDLIITNPPFGATFSHAELLLKATRKHLPVMFEMNRTGLLPRAVDSEYILLDRELALLRPGGRLMMVVPDHVVSGGGFSELFRTELQLHYELIAVIDLPVETFAQAGTRTKTSVVYLRRPKSAQGASRTHLFMGCIDDLGFKVVSRGGVTRKQLCSANQIPELVRAYARFAGSAEPNRSVVSLGASPNATAVARSAVVNGRWTAGFYRPERLAALESGVATLKPLCELVVIDPESSERVVKDSRNVCISVLHVREDGSLDLAAIQAYAPTTPCIRCRPGDVLLSKINPRIVRIAVVPDLGVGVGCSAEFAVIRSKPGGASPWELALVLRSSSAQAQIQSLTSGTSSSHNRIKARDLEVVEISVPPCGTEPRRALSARAAALERAISEIYKAQAVINDAFASMQQH